MPSLVHAENIGFLQSLWYDTSKDTAVKFVKH